MRTENGRNLFVIIKTYIELMFIYKKPQAGCLFKFVIKMDRYMYMYTVGSKL